MKAAKLYTFDDIRIEDMPVPEIGPRDILVKMKACGICSGDVLPWYIERKAPLVLGHEPAGVVEAVGSEVSRWQKGDRVFVHHHAPEMTSKAALDRRYSICPTWKASNLDPGGMAEFVRVPELNAEVDTLKLPDHVSFDGGVMVEPFACSVQSVERANVSPATSVVVLGLGVMGVLNVIAAKLWGARQIIGVDCVPYRLDKALKVGADEVINFKEDNVEERVKSITAGEKADVVIVGPGSTAAMDSAMKLVGKGGTVQLFTPTAPDERWSISPFQLYLEDITISTSYSCGPSHTRRSLDLIAAGKVPVDEVITHRYPLSEVHQAYQLMAEAQDSLKAVVYLDQ